MYRDHRRVPGVHREGPPAPKGPMGYMWRGTSPLVGWAPSPPGPMRLRVLGNPKGRRPPSLGGQGNPPGRRPLLRLDLRGPAPLSLAPIYMWGVGGQPHQSSGAALPLFHVLLLSRGAWRSPAGLPCSSTTITPLCCCWMESSPTSPSLLAGSRHGRRHWAVRVSNTEVPSVRH